MRLDVVVCSVNDEKFQSLCRSLRGCDAWQLGEIIRINDAQSMCEGYNRGGLRSSSDWVLFCHDDIEVLRWNSETIQSAFNAYDVLGVCGTNRLIGPNWYDSDPNNLRGAVVAPAGGGAYDFQIFGGAGRGVCDVQALDGIFIACRKAVWERLKFDEDIPWFTGYDVEFSYRAYLSSYRVGVVCDLLLYHDSHVGNFSEEKLNKWRVSQELIRNKFRLRSMGDNYVKHNSVLFPALASLKARDGR